MTAFALPLPPSDAPEVVELPGLEELLVSPEWFGLTTATPLQRAICRIAEGKPVGDLLELPLVEGLEAYPPEVQERATWEWALADIEVLQAWEPLAPPAEMYVISAIRCAKSLMAICAGIWAALHADWSKVGLRPGEVVRFPIVSTSKDNAKAINEHLRGVVNTRVGDFMSAKTRAALLDEERETVETIEIVHPDGVIVEINVAAGSRAGSKVVSRWLVGILFDEAPRMLASEEGVVNLEDQAAAVAGRILTTLWAVGSPFAPVGKVFEAVNDNEGPTDDRVVVRGVGPALNPYWWTPERCHDLKRRNPDAFWTDVCCEFAAGESSAFPIGWLKRCTRDKGTPIVPREEGVSYVAYTDPGTRSNAWTLSIAGIRANGVQTQVYVREWLPPGSFEGPEEAAAWVNGVLREMAEDLADYGLHVVTSDQLGYDFLATAALPHGISVDLYNATGTSNTLDSEELRKRLHAGSVELSPNAQVQGDMRRGKRKPVGNAYRYSWPQTGDGRHCDFGPVTVRSLACPAPPYVPPEEDPLAGMKADERAVYERALRLQEGAESDDMWNQPTEQHW